MIQPQIKEIVEFLLKQIVKGDLKVVSYETLTKIIRSGHSLQFSETILKSLLKNQDKEFHNEQSECLSALLNDYPNSQINWSTVWPELMLSAIREIESGNQNCKILYNMMRVRLLEAKQQGNISTPSKEFNLSLKIDSKKKVNSIPLEAPRTMLEVLSLCSSIMVKVQSAQDVSQAQQNVCQGVGLALQKLFLEFPEHIENVHYENLISLMMVTIINTKQAVIQRKIVQNILCSAFESLKDSSDYLQQTTLFIFECLKSQKLVYKLQKVQTQPLKLNETAATTLLTSFNFLIKQQEQNSVQKWLEQSGETCNSFVDVMIPYLQLSATSQQTCEIIQSIGQSSPTWLHQLISLFISSVQIATADFVSSSAAQYVYTQQKSQFLTVENLNKLTEALTCLLKISINVIGGEPIALMNAIFQSATAFIIGKQSSAQIYQSLTLSQITMIQVGRREHGWTIMQGLFYLGQSWIDRHYTELIKLFETAFSKTMCQIDQERLVKDPTYQEVFVQEFKTKNRALMALRILLNQNLDRKTIQTFGKLLANATEFFIPKVDTKILALVDQVDIIQAKSNYFDCLNLIPCQFYQSKLVTLLHNMCEVLVGTNSNLPNGFLDQQDEPLSQFQKSLTETPQKQQQQENDQAQKQLEPQTRFVQVSINLFGKVFKSPSLTATNKDQLVSHFLAHTAPSVKKTKQQTGEITVVQLPYRPDKIKKMQRLGVALLVAIRQCENIRNYQQSLTEICQNLLKVCDPTLARICCEINIEMFAQELLQKGPQQLLDVIEESLTKNLKLNNHQELMNAAAICGHIVRHFDERIGTPIDRITNIFLKLFRSSNEDVIKFSMHFAYQISLEHSVFRAQLLPTIFSIFYGTTQYNEISVIRVSQFGALSLNEKNMYTEIISQDHQTDLEILRASVEQGNISDNVFERLNDLEIVQQLFTQGLTAKIETKYKGNLLYHLLDQIQFEEKNSVQKWKELYRTYNILKVQQYGISQHLEFVKQQCFQYVHLSAKTLMEQSPGTVNLFKAKLSMETLSFIVEEIIHIVKTIDQPYKTIVEVMQFALSIVTHNDKIVKVSGFNLLKCTIQLLSQVVEHVGDIDEDLSPRTRERQNYIQNPLFLEQFEAQIFSVIRQSLSTQGADLQHEIIQASLDLIYDFITLPITRDQSLIKKIIGMLVNKDMDRGLQIYQNELFQHEGLIAETHFLKLKLLSRLIIKYHGSNFFEFQQSKMKSCDLPSKFVEEDRLCLKECFEVKTLSTIGQHSRAAIQDFISLNQSQGGQKIFLQGGTYSREKIGECIPSIIEALRLNGSTESQLVADCILQGLKAPFQENLLKFYEEKIVYLKLALASISQIQPKLSELAPILSQLTQLGIAQINEEVLKIYITIQDKQIGGSSLTSNLIINQSLNMLMQAEPEFSGTPQLTQSSKNPILIQYCLQSLVMSAKLICSTQSAQKSIMANELMQQVVTRLCMFVTTKDQQNDKKFTNTLITILQLLQGLPQEIKNQLSLMSLTLIKEIIRFESTTTDLIIILLTDFIEQNHLDLVTEILSSISQQQFKNMITIINGKVNTDWNSFIVKFLVIKTFEQFYSDVNADSQSALLFLLRFYKSIDSENRIKMLTPYYALILQTIQCKVEGAPRILAAEHLVELFKFDVVAIKAFATSTDARGQQMISGSEKTITENIIRNYQAQQAAIVQSSQPVVVQHDQNKNETSSASGQVRKKLELKKLKPN